MTVTTKLIWTNLLVSDDLLKRKTVTITTVNRRSVAEKAYMTRRDQMISRSGLNNQDWNDLTLLQGL